MSHPLPLLLWPAEQPENQARGKHRCECTGLTSGTHKEQGPQGHGQPLKMLLSPQQQPPSRGEGWCCSGGLRQAGTAQMAPPGVPRHRWLPQAAWENATVPREPGPALRPAGPGTSRAWGEPQGGFQSCSHSPDVPTQHTSHPKPCDLLASNPAPDVNHMKNNCLGHRGHFPLLRGGGWIRSQVLARSRQRSHCDWPVWLQQTLVLPVLLSHCSGHTL